MTRTNNHPTPLSVRIDVAPGVDASRHPLVAAWQRGDMSVPFSSRWSLNPPPPDVGQLVAFHVGEVPAWAARMGTMHVTEGAVEQSWDVAEVLERPAAAPRGMLFVDPTA